MQTLATHHRESFAWHDKRMTAETGLTALQDRAWRMLVRLTVLLPRAVDDDLRRASELQLTSIGVLMHLSEAPDHRLRMSDLAESTAMSPSRITRAVQTLATTGDVYQCASEADGRATIAVLTASGERRLREAMPAHLASLRERVLDQIEPEELKQFVSILTRLVARSEAPSAIRSSQPSGGIAGVSAV